MRCGEAAVELDFPISKSILSVVPAVQVLEERIEISARALPIEFVELSRAEGYGDSIALCFTRAGECV
jgi:hypothetical protein